MTMLEYLNWLLSDPLDDAKREAIASFQDMHGLIPDGARSPETLVAIAAAIAALEE
jgi:hypothetical protein